MTAEFLIVTVLVAATPGTGVIYTLTHALAHGVGEGIRAAAGCAVSAVPHLVAAATGLVALLQASSAAFRGVTLAGSAYLLPAADGRPLLRILEQQGVHLVVESLVGPPMPDSNRERRTQEGPRGLGVVLGFEAQDIDPIYQYAIEWRCEITCEPMDEEWGHRVFTFVDPFGFEWEPTQQIVQKSVEEGNRAVAEKWAEATC